jgi:hypothetical protein
VTRVTPISARSSSDLYWECRSSSSVVACSGYARNFDSVDPQLLNALLHAIPQRRDDAQPALVLCESIGAKPADLDRMLEVLQGLVQIGAVYPG